MRLEKLASPRRQRSMTKRHFPRSHGSAHRHPDHRARNQQATVSAPAGAIERPRGVVGPRVAGRVAQLPCRWRHVAVGTNWRPSTPDVGNFSRRSPARKPQSLSRNARINGENLRPPDLRGLKSSRQRRNSPRDLWRARSSRLKALGMAIPSAGSSNQRPPRYDPLTHTGYGHRTQRDDGRDGRTGHRTVQTRRSLDTVAGRQGIRDHDAGHSKWRHSDGQGRRATGSAGLRSRVVYQRHGLRHDANRRCSDRCP